MVGEPPGVGASLRVNLIRSDPIGDEKVNAYT